MENMQFQNSTIKKMVLNPNENWNLVEKFFNAKRIYDYKNGKTPIKDWIYICFDDNDCRGDIPLDAWKFIHISRLPWYQNAFEAAKKRKPILAPYMTFEILWRVDGYVPYVKKQAL